MQTFLPYADFTETAACLDVKRLGKQRVECLQILKALVLPVYGWQHHPAVCLWRGFERCLYQNYMSSICIEWAIRGYKDTCYAQATTLLRRNLNFRRQNSRPPGFIGRADYHAAHRSNLLRKDWAYYSKFGWSEPANLPYVWPLSV